MSEKIILRKILKIMRVIFYQTQDYRKKNVMTLISSTTVTMLPSLRPFRLKLRIFVISTEFFNIPQQSGLTPRL